jgi:hypothetical protein
MKRLVVIACTALICAGCNTSRSMSDNKFEQVPQVIAANEMAAIARLRSIVTAEMTLQFEGDGKYATLDELVAKGALSKPSQGKLTGYRFDVKVKPGGFEATAVPVTPNVSGKRSFYVDESRIMRAADKGGVPASASDPAVQ